MIKSKILVLMFFSILTMYPVKSQQLFLKIDSVKKFNKNNFGKCGSLQTTVYLTISNESFDTVNIFSSTNLRIDIDAPLMPYQRFVRCRLDDYDNSCIYDIKIPPFAKISKSFNEHYFHRYDLMKGNNYKLRYKITNENGRLSSKIPKTKVFYSNYINMLVDW